MNGVPVSAPGRSLQIPGALVALSHGIDELEKTMAVLAGRLSPIMGIEPTDPPYGESLGKEKIPIQGEIAVRILEMARRLLLIQRGVQGITDRLEI